MPYRRTPQVVRRQAARHQAILAAARTIAAEGGMAALQIAAVATSAGIATGTVYRYFPSKSELVSALIGAVAEREIDAMTKAGRAAPGPLSALAASIATFAARSLGQRKLAWALIAEPAEVDVEAVRFAFRRALSETFQKRITAAIQAGYLPAQNVDLAAAALIGVLFEGVIGPLAPSDAADEAHRRDLAQAITLLSLRALGVVDARARGMVVQIAIPTLADA